MDDARTSGALQARLISVFLLDFVVNVARPVDMVCCVHLEVPKSSICDRKAYQVGPITHRWARQTVNGGRTRSDNNRLHEYDGTLSGKNSRSSSGRLYIRQNYNTFRDNYLHGPAREGRQMTPSMSSDTPIYCPYAGKLETSCSPSNVACLPTSDSPRN